jgi:hypothetical protein
MCVCVMERKRTFAYFIYDDIRLNIYELFFFLSDIHGFMYARIKFSWHSQQHYIARSQNPELKCVCGLAVYYRSDPTPLSWVLVVLKKLSILCAEVTQVFS